MELRVLRAFVEVVRQGGFTAAAKVIFATQSTVTKAVKQLEDEIGMQLILRVGHTVRLTEAGEVVHRRALAMLGERDHMLSEIAEFKGLRRGTLKIGLPPVGSSILFAPLFARFRRLHPNIDIVLQEQGGDRLKEMVLSSELDLAAFLLPVEEIFAAQAVCNEPMMALLPHDHALAQAGKTSVRLAELADSPMILFQKGFSLNQVVEDACRKRGFVPREAARSAQPEFIVSLVAAGLGIAMLPRLVVKRMSHPAIHLAQIDDEDLRWRLGMVWRKGANLPFAASAWLKLTEDFAKKNLPPLKPKRLKRPEAARTERRAKR
jgi:DNA-binding transcriptional LysR family regulator